MTKPERANCERQRISGYGCWRMMIRRCTNETHSSYPRYGGRGITVCNEWMDFANFIRDMGPRPDGGTIERIDNDKGYFKENCRWATYAEQNRNKRKHRSIAGYKSIADAADATGLEMETIRRRLDRGYTEEEAVSLPLMHKSNKKKKPTLRSIAEEAGIHPTTLRTRLSHGWSLDNALTTPIGRREGHS